MAACGDPDGSFASDGFKIDRVLGRDLDRDLRGCYRRTFLSQPNHAERPLADAADELVRTDHFFRFEHDICGGSYASVYIIRGGKFDIDGRSLAGKKGLA